jgi:hypothetical protein
VSRLPVSPRRQAYGVWALAGLLPVAVSWLGWPVAVGGLLVSAALAVVGWLVLLDAAVSVELGAAAEVVFARWAAEAEALEARMAARDVEVVTGRPDPAAVATDAAESAHVGGVR